MSKRKTKHSQKFKEDSLSRKISYLDFKKIDQQTFLNEIPNEQEANDILNKIKEMKKAIEERLSSLKKNEEANKINNKNNLGNKNNIDNSKEKVIKINTSEIPKIDSFIELYKKHLKLKDYISIPSQVSEGNANTKKRSIIAEFFISKEILTLKVENIIEAEGKKHLSVLLKHKNIFHKDKTNNNNKTNKNEIESEKEEENNKGIIISYDTQNDADDVFNITQAENLHKTINLEIIDSRDIAYIIKDITIAMIRILEEKFGKTDKNGINFGITHRVLNEIFKIKKPVIAQIRESDTSNKGEESVRSEVGGYEDEQEYEFEDEDLY